MDQPTLYLMVGYPGAGKTTVSKVIHELTGAEHLWADHERRKHFRHPEYSHQENLQLYGAMNNMADALLAAGRSVIFDTSFNFHRDREHLRQIATRRRARTVVVWVQTPKPLAHARATQEAHQGHTRPLGVMPDTDFSRIARSLEEPRPDEAVVIIDGSRVDKAAVAAALGLPVK